ncbi:uncharacterized [Tachysurus ichikawai]
MIPAVGTSQFWLRLCDDLIERDTSSKMRLSDCWVISLPPSSGLAVCLSEVRSGKGREGEEEVIGGDRAEGNKRGQAQIVAGFLKVHQMYLRIQFCSSGTSVIQNC